VAFLNAIAERLKNEGKECLWTLGLDAHSNALYKRAGFKEVGRTPRTGHPVFVKKLR
jgi:predicted GNAT family acetyltransferase